MSFVLSVILGIVFRILLAIAINLDCRARNIGARKIYTVLTVFFPAIIGIVYAIKRKGEKKELKVCRSCGTKASAYSAKCPKCGGLFLMDYTPPKAKQLKTASIILCVIALIAFGVNQAYSLPSEIEDIKSEIMGAENPEDVEEDYVDDYGDSIISSSGLFYDKNGYAYSNYEDVEFYDINGNTYIHVNIDNKTDATTKNHFKNTETGEELFIGCCYVDSDGYFCFIDDNSLSPLSNDKYEYYAQTDNEEQVELVNVTFEDKDGNLYYRADQVSWTYPSKMLIQGEEID